MPARLSVLLIALALAGTAALVVIRSVQHTPAACEGGVCPRVLPAATGDYRYYPLARVRTLPATRGFLLRPTAFATTFIPALVRGITKSFFLPGMVVPCVFRPQPGPSGPRGPYEPDITTVDPADPHGERLLSRCQSSFTLGRFPPNPLPPPDFRVEKLEQRGLVEESPAPAQLIGPQNVGQGRFP